jgi:hypothetical protein
MTAVNVYATLADYKAYVVARGQASEPDVTDDGVIEGLLETASRYIDDETGRNFYPYVQTRYFDVPESRELCVDEDLLEVLTLTNGDSTTMPSTEYYLVPRNIYPAYALKITDISSYTWLTNSAGSYENAVSINAIWGFRQRYSAEGWKLAGTLGAAVADTSTLSFTMTAGHTLKTGQVWRVNNELVQGTVNTNTLNIDTRGANGSTAASHLINTAVYYWQPEQGAKNAVLEIANSAYRRRFGNTTSSAVTITGAGVVISPRDIPATAQAFIESHKDRL